MGLKCGHPNAELVTLHVVPDFEWIVQEFHCPDCGKSWEEQ